MLVGVLLESSWGTLGSSWTLLGASWAALAASWAPGGLLVRTWRRLGVLLGVSWTLLEGSWRRLETCWKPFGSVLEAFEGFLDAPESILEASGGCLLEYVKNRVFSVVFLDL